MLKVRSLFFSVLISVVLSQPCMARSQVNTVEQIFSDEHALQLVLDVEAAIARVQAKHGYIPEPAAQEISQTATLSVVPLAAVTKERSRVSHRMVAVLNVWRSALSEPSAQYLHFGVTTVDIYDTLLALQLVNASTTLLRDLRGIEAILIELATQYKSAPMVGRTLGQHALPITFGKKVSTWIGAISRNIDRLKFARSQLQHCAILKGAVGTYSGLGPNAIEVERDFAGELGLAEPYSDDWHGSRDVFAYYALSLALISKSFGQIGQEVFLLQSTDLGEVSERRSPVSESSSSMPHKSNPRLSESLIHASRRIPRLAEIVLDDVISFYERDNVSEPNAVIREATMEVATMLQNAQELLSGLEVHEDAMRENLGKTKGYLMAQRVALALSEEIGKAHADELLKNLIKNAVASGQNFRDALQGNAAVRQHLTESQLDSLLVAETYTGLAQQEVDAVISHAKARRNSEQSSIDELGFANGN